MEGGRYNLRNPAVKRIMQVRQALAQPSLPFHASCDLRCTFCCVLQEMKELQKDPTSDFKAAALEVRWVIGCPANDTLVALQYMSCTPVVNSQACCCPAQDNIFEWHFAVRGPPDTEFEVRLAFSAASLPAVLNLQAAPAHQVCQSLQSVLLLSRGRRAVLPKRKAMRAAGGHLPRAHPAAAGVPLQAAQLPAAVAQRPL